MTTKTCNICQKTKPLDQFWKKAARCARCQNDIRNAWYKTADGRAHIARMNLAPARKFCRLRYQARKRGIPLTITRADYELLIALACHYCGGRIEDTGAGIDRKDNTRGYLLGNLVPSCRWCNLVKNDRYSYEEMLVLGKVIRSIHQARSVNK